MDSYQLVAGLSDIKKELVVKTGSSKALSEVQLWFSYEDGVLYAHDYNDHAKCIVLAILKIDETWVYFLQSNGYGFKLIKEATEQYLVDTIAKELNSTNFSHGFVPT